jgi:hypothetical protein
VSGKSTKQSKKGTRPREKHTQLEAVAPVKAQPQPPVPQPSHDFERELQDHLAAEERKKVEEAAENIFGSVLARHGWVRNEHGQVEYVGGDGA